MAKLVPEDIKRNVRAVLLSKVGGVPINKFSTDYKNLVLEPLKYKNLGFDTLKAFLESMPEIARLQGSETDLKVFGVAEPNTYLPIGARKAQGRLPRNYHKKLQQAKEESKDLDLDCTDSGIPSSSSSTMDELQLVPDTAGLFSVCFKLDKAPSDDKAEIRKLFTQAGPVKNIYISPHYVFVRFESPDAVFASLDLYADKFDLKIADNNLPDSAKAEIKNKKKQRQGPSSKPRPEHKGTQQNGVKENGTCSYDDKTSLDLREQHKLFIGGIDNTETFDDIVAPYNPVTRSYIPAKNGPFWNGWIVMETAEIAQEALQNLRKVKMGGQKLIVEFARKSSSKPKNHNTKSEEPPNSGSTPAQKPTEKSKSCHGSVKSDEKSNSGSNQAQRHRSTDKPRRDNNMPNGEKRASKTYHNGAKEQPSLSSVKSKTKTQSPLKTDKKLDSEPTQERPADMPELITISKADENPDHYLDCTVMVANFPTDITMGAIQDAFSKYGLKDIFLSNSNLTLSCSQAILYLNTISNVIRCVEEMNSYKLGGRNLKVDVPYQNKKMRSTLKDRLKLPSAPKSHARKKEDCDLTL